MKAPTKFYAICGRCYLSYKILGRHDIFKNFLFRRRVTAGGHELSVLDRTMLCAVCEEVSGGEDPSPLLFYAVTSIELNKAMEDVLSEQAADNEPITS